MRKSRCATGTSATLPDRATGQQTPVAPLRLVATPQSVPVIVVANAERL